MTLRSRLEARRGEIEAALTTRIGSIADPGEVADPAYAEGLRAALADAFEYALEAIERGEGREPPVPVALLAQARLAARNGVGLDTVLRRYFAGYSLLGDFILAETVGSGSLSEEPERLHRTLSAALDRLVVAVGAEYEREAHERRRDSAERRAERVRRLLRGELREAGDLGYELDAHHLALVGNGAGAREAIRELSRPLDRRLLLVEAGEGVVWSWLGGQSAFEPDRVADFTPPSSPAGRRRSPSRSASPARAQRVGASATVRLRPRSRWPSAAPTPWSATATSPSWRPFSRTICPPPPCAGSTWSRWRRSATAAPAYAKRSVPTSVPAAGSVRLPPPWA